MGGMVVPALIYLAFNSVGTGARGLGRPDGHRHRIRARAACRSCDVASRPRVFVFLTALAIFDDLGAIVVIARVLRGHDRRAVHSRVALLTVVLVVLGRARVQSLWPYAVVGVLLWVAVLQLGHPRDDRRRDHRARAADHRPSEPASRCSMTSTWRTTSLRRDCDRRGVAPDGAIAAIERHLESVQSPLDRAMHGLHGVVAFGVVPLFALANAGVSRSRLRRWAPP